MPNFVAMFQTVRANVGRSIPDIWPLELSFLKSLKVIKSDTVRLDTNDFLSTVTMALYCTVSDISGDICRILKFILN